MTIEKARRRYPRGASLRVVGGDRNGRPNQDYSL